VFEEKALLIRAQLSAFYPGDVSSRWQLFSRDVVAFLYYAVDWLDRGGGAGEFTLLQKDLQPDLSPDEWRVLERSLEGGDYGGEFAQVRRANAVGKLASDLIDQAAQLTRDALTR
jgi:hypothetical protein